MFRRSKNKLGCGMAQVIDPGHLGLIATVRQGFSVKHWKLASQSTPITRMNPMG